MKNKLFFVSLLCFFFMSWSMPVFSHSNIALSATLEKEGIPQGQAANTPNSDIFISDQVQDALKNVAPSNGTGKNVNVEIKNGVVTLTGVVADQKAKDKVGQIVANVPGVKGVINKLETTK
jgi:osmotically-inducible protein OsmY